MLGLQGLTDVPFTVAQAHAYNLWASDHTQEGEGRLFAAGAVPAMHTPEHVQAVADEIRAVGEMPGMVSVFMRPNPAVAWKHFNDPVYDPIWQASADTGLPIALAPIPCSRSARSLPGVTPSRWRPLQPGPGQPGRRHGLDHVDHRRRGVRAFP